MDIYPAIDLRNGRVVRLSQGEPTRQTVYGDDPLAVAEQFLSAGAEWLHVIDLDRAFDSGTNAETVARIVAAAGRRARVQVGGGLRSRAAVDTALNSGAARAVIGTAAVTDPDLLAALVRGFGSGRVAVGIDARRGRVAVRGWREASGLSTHELAARAAGAGVRTVIYTDIDRDGMLAGPDLSGAQALQAAGVEVIASGGVADVADVAAACRAKLAGVILGRALYEGKLRLPDALQAAAC